MENKLMPIDFNDIKSHLFETGDYLPFDINECSKKSVNNFVISESNTLDNSVSNALLSKDPMMWEGLIRTYPIDVLKKYVCNTLQFNEKQFQIKEKNGIKYAIIYYRYDEETKEWILRSMNLGGYHVAQERIGSGNNEGLRQIIFEPKFEDNILEELISYGVLYHITQKKNINRIKHIGLCPRSNSSLFEYPERIYLLKGNVDDTFIFNLVQSLSVSKTGNFNPSDYSVLLIDPKLLPIDTRFYEDPNLEGSVFTYANIPPKCIMNIKNFVKNGE